MQTQRGRRISQWLLWKEKSDQESLEWPRIDWYRLENEHLMSPLLQSTFLAMDHDETARQFIENSTSASNSISLQLYYMLGSMALQLFMSKTTSNGVLNRGGMHIFSDRQFKELIDLPNDWVIQDKKLLDLGAGDGAVTQAMSRYYGKTFVTETSPSMRWRLRQKKFSVLPIEEWQNGSYDLISALNLLDRHYDPKALLQDLHKTALISSCPVLLAVVFPFSRFVEFNPGGEMLGFVGDILLDEHRTFEQQANAFAHTLLIPAGFQLIRWTKLPYLCEGGNYIY